MAFYLKKNVGGVLQKNDPFYSYYLREMNYLRHSGTQFAHRYPKVARRLDMSAHESSDPHVERLLESFAYLTARLQQDTDDQFPRFAEAVLNQIYPHFTHPVPSMAVARFEPHAHGGQATTQYTIPQHTKLFTRTNDGTVCRFRTVYPVDLHPIEITKVSVDNTAANQNLSSQLSTAQVLYITIKALSGTFATMGLQRLRLYINGNHKIKHQLLEGLLTAQSAIIVRSPNQGDSFVPPSCLKPVGFGSDEMVLPMAVQTHQAYHTLFEYFHYADKFAFIDIETPVFNTADTSLEIILPLRLNTSIHAQDIHKQTVLLGCTPIINLFPKVTEPIIVDHKSFEYKLVADYTLEHATEIYSIDNVTMAVEGSDQTQQLSPYFGHHFTASKENQNLFWTMRRAPVPNKTASGSDVFISLTDLTFDPHEPPRQTLYAHALCTNRLLARHISPGALLYPEDSIASQKITCLNRPTEPIHPSMNGETQWRLISHLALDHLGLIHSATAVQTLKDLLRLYCREDDAKPLLDIDALHDIRIKTITRRLPGDHWRGFVQGTKIILTFDDALGFEGLFTFSSVLNQFFTLVAAVNTFTQLDVRLKSQEGVWFSWPPLVGSKPLL